MLTVLWKRKITVGFPLANEHHAIRKVMTLHKKNVLTRCISMYYVTGFKQTHGSKNVTLKAAKNCGCRGLLGTVVTELAIFAISVGKHGRQLLNEFFISWKDLTQGPGYLKEWRTFKMTAAVLGPKILSRTCIQGIYES